MKDAIEINYDLSCSFDCNFYYLKIQCLYKSKCNISLNQKAPRSKQDVVEQRNFCFPSKIEKNSGCEINLRRIIRVSIGSSQFTEK